MDLSLSDDELAFQREAREWLDANVGPTPSFANFDEEFAWGREWQARLAADRWVGIHWPTEYGGRSATPIQVAIFNMEYARSKAPQPVNRTGVNLAGPTLLAHGTDEQKHRWLPGILSADEIWCQLFSEPGAGSDLASLSTRATPTDDGWVLSGQKVWTSYAQFSRWGIALVRTDPERRVTAASPTWWSTWRRRASRSDRCVTMTAEAEFNEVFFDEVFVPARPPHRWAQQRVGRGQHDARPRAGHDVPVQGTGRARGVPRRVDVAWRRRTGRSTTRSSPTNWSTPTCSSGSSACTTGGP